MWRPWLRQEAGVEVTQNGGVVPNARYCGAAAARNQTLILIDG